MNNLLTLPIDLSLLIMLKLPDHHLMHFWSACKNCAYLCGDDSIDFWKYRLGYDPVRSSHKETYKLCTVARQLGAIVYLSLDTSKVQVFLHRDNSPVNGNSLTGDYRNIIHESYLPEFCEYYNVSNGRDSSITICEDGRARLIKLNGSYYDKNNARFIISMLKQFRVGKENYYDLSLATKSFYDLLEGGITDGYRMVSLIPKRQIPSVLYHYGYNFDWDSDGYEYDTIYSYSDEDDWPIDDIDYWRMEYECYNHRDGDSWSNFSEQIFPSSHDELAGFWADTRRRLMILANGELLDYTHQIHRGKHPKERIKERIRKMGGNPCKYRGVRRTYCKSSFEEKDERVKKKARCKRQVKTFISTNKYVQPNS